jgi:(2Fe-2S) ferredoxin
MVVYPQETWYSYVDEEDLEEILQKHLIGGEEVSRLKI